MELIEILNNVWSYVLVVCFILTTIKLFKIVRIKYRRIRNKYRKAKRFIKSKGVRRSLGVLRMLLRIY